MCRPEPEVLECLTPPGGPPEPPLRQPPPDPLNLHPRIRIPAPPPPAPEYEEPQPIFDVKFGVSMHVTRNLFSITDACDRLIIYFYIRVKINVAQF